MTTENLMDQSSDNEQIDDNKDYLKELVGEDKKFKDVQALAKGKALSDNYIRILESRIDSAREDLIRLRDENITGQKLQERIDELKRLEEQRLASREQPESNEVTQKPEMDLTKIESLVEQKIQQKSQIEKEEKNYSEVKSKLEERFGSKYAQILQEKAKTLGLSSTDVNQMARLNPNLFYKTFDLNTKANGDNLFQTPPNASLRSDNFSPTGSNERTLSYYQELRKKNPMAWYDPKIAVQMDKDSQRLGTAFYDT